MEPVWKCDRTVIFPVGRGTNQMPHIARSKLCIADRVFLFRFFVRIDFWAKQPLAARENSVGMFRDDARLERRRSCARSQRGFFCKRGRSKGQETQRCENEG